MNWDWSLIANAAVTLVCTAVLVFCVPVLKARLGEEKLEKLQNWIAVGVQAAEQLFGKGEGQRKKEYVLSLLLSKGLVHSVDDVTALLESEAQSPWPSLVCGAEKAGQPALPGLFVYGFVRLILPTI